MTPPCSLALLILLIISMTSYKTRVQSSLKEVAIKTGKQIKALLSDRKQISQKRQHLAETVKGTFLCQMPAQPKEGLADEECNCGNTQRVPRANFKSRRVCREIGQKGGRSVQSRCPGKATSVLNLTQDCIFMQSRKYLVQIHSKEME